MRPDMEPDEDPDVALAVILGEQKGNVTYALICLLDAIRHGDYPDERKIHDRTRIRPRP